MARIQEQIARKRAKHAEMVEKAPTAELILAEDIRYLGSLVATVKIGGDPAKALDLRRIVQEATEKVLAIALKGDDS